MIVLEHYYSMYHVHLLLEGDLMTLQFLVGFPEMAVLENIIVHLQSGLQCCALNVAIQSFDQLFMVVLVLAFLVVFLLFHLLSLCQDVLSGYTS